MGGVSGVTGRVGVEEVISLEEVVKDRQGLAKVKFWVWTVLAGILGSECK